MTIIGVGVLYSKLKTKIDTGIDSEDNNIKYTNSTGRHEKGAV